MGYAFCTFTAMKLKYPWQILLGAGVLLALLVLAIVFYLERIGHIDMAFQTFLILKSGSPDIQSGRFGAMATQCWPWLAQAMNLPLKWVLLFYSMGHVLWPAILFAWICWLRAWKWALVLVLVLTGMTTHTFYWLSEMPQGLVFLVAIFAWMSTKNGVSALKWWEWILWTASVVTAFYFHPLVMYAAIFGCLFFILRDYWKNAFWKSPRSLFAMMMGMLALLTFLKFKVFKLDWYDAIALDKAKAFEQLWPHWLDIQSNRDLLEYLFRDYWFVLLGLFPTVLYYVWKKRWLLGFLTALYPLGFVLMVNIPYHESTHQFYMENLWLPLGLFAAIPLVFDVLPGLLSEMKMALVISAIALLGLFRIYQAHKPWTDRLNWERAFLHEASTLTHKKWILSEQQVPMDTIKLAWSMPYEFLMLSSLESPDSSKCILVTNDLARFDTLLNKPGLFLGPFKNYTFDKFPKRYFNLKDSSAYMRWMK